MVLVGGSHSWRRLIRNPLSNTTTPLWQGNAIFLQRTDPIETCWLSYDDSFNQPTRKQQYYRNRLLLSRLQSCWACLTSNHLSIQDRLFLLHIYIYIYTVNFEKSIYNSFDLDDDNQPVVIVWYFAYSSSSSQNNGWWRKLFSFIYFFLAWLYLSSCLSII
jgi:hypothetical protein